MSGTKLKRVTVYFTEAEWAAFADGADTEGLSFSNYIRSWARLPPLKRGAPQGNFNRVLGTLSPRQEVEKSGRQKSSRASQKSR
jgi:hypothetical protein